MTSGFVSNLRREFKTLRSALRSLDGTLRRVISTNGSATAHLKRRRRTVRLSAKARASLVLQGRYMGYMRQLKPRQKAQVRKVREAKGVRAAIAKAREIAEA